MKSEAYYQGIRARMSELYKLGLEEKNPYIPHSDESIAWFCGWYEAKKAIESVNQSLAIFDESGINLKITNRKMTKFKKEYLPTLILSTLVLGIIFCGIQACKKVDEIAITSKEAIIAEYQKQMLLQKHDTLTTREYIYLDRWHDAKVITKHTIDSIYITSPDTCKPYIQSIEKVYQSERNAANLVHSSDSMIINNLEAIVKVDLILIAKSKQDLKATQDTITDLRKPKPLKRFINNTKHVVTGVLVGAAIVEVINVVKP